MASNNFDAFDPWEADGPLNPGLGVEWMELDLLERQMIYRMREMHELDSKRYDDLTVQIAMWAGSLDSQLNRQLRDRQTAREEAWSRGALRQHQEFNRWLRKRLAWQRHTAQFSNSDRRLQTFLRDCKREAKAAVKRGEAA